MRSPSEVWRFTPNAVPASTKLSRVARVSAQRATSATRAAVEEAHFVQVVAAALGLVAR